MEIITKLDKISESSSNCPGCGSILGLKLVLQSLENMKNVVLVTSPGDIALLGKAGLKVSFVNSRNPAATAQGLSLSRPDLNVIVYSGDSFTKMNLPTLLSVKGNFLYVCYNNSGYANIDVMSKTSEFAKIAAANAVYAATASVAYYEDFITKLKKSFSINGFKFIDLLAPCPALWNYDSSNTIEIGRMATESLYWPLYEIENQSVTVTKIPQKIEQVHRFLEMIKTPLPADMQAMQEYVSKRWKGLNEGRLV
jgi:pyruvate ferredoxin oxidoreductase beta subunit